MQTLTRDRLERLVPSAFALTAHPDVSGRYQQYRTFEMIEALQDNGWEPFQASESRVRDQGRQGYQKHMIRFRHPDYACSPRSRG